MKNIKAKKEACAKCKSTLMENLVRIEEGEPMKVYVVCAKCGAFVARYKVSRYTSDKPYASLLKILRISPSCPDSREMIKELEAFSSEVEKEFKETKKLIETKPTEKKIEELLKEKK